jgi:hypothetical protein
LVESGEYAIDFISSNNDGWYRSKCVPRQVPDWSTHTKVTGQTYESCQRNENEIFYRLRALEKNPGADCASTEEIGEEMVFFSKILHCYDACFLILRRTRMIFNIEEITALEASINQLQLLWPVGTKRGISDS